MNRLLLLILSSLVVACSGCEYSVAESPWEESFGNHRAVIKVGRPADAVNLDVEWRRHDKSIDNVMFLIINAETGDTIPNILRREVNREKCCITFGPVSKAGTYFFYYLPFPVERGHGYTSGDYYPVENKPDSSWVQKAKEATATANLVRFESRTAFDSFFPMEVIATAAESEEYIKQNDQPWYAFPEDRMNPIRMRHDIPQKWLAVKQGEGFYGKAAPNEYYTFQIGIWAPKEDVKSVAYSISDLVAGSNVIPSSAITCFNLEGIGPYGDEFTKEVNVPAGDVQALWFGVDIPENQKTGTYKGSVTISSADGYAMVLPVSVKVGGRVIADRGDSELWRHSRLRWLNSQLSVSDEPTSDFPPISVNGLAVNVAGKTITMDAKSGLPAQISHKGKDVFNSPMEFSVETPSGKNLIAGETAVKEATDGHVIFASQSCVDNLSFDVETRAEFDGWTGITVTLTAGVDINVRNASLLFPVNEKQGKYFMGLGLEGQRTPSYFKGGWKQTSSNRKYWPFDSFWIGNYDAGFQAEFRGSSYSGPLLNLYHPEFPKSWYNDGKGGFSISSVANQVKISAYSGPFKMKAGEKKTFEFAILATPIKELDTHSQFVNRYYHNGQAPTPTQEELDNGVKIINVHHASAPNPYINYPFLSRDTLCAFVNRFHNEDVKVKIYYTLRELSNSAYEIWAFRSLGTELLRDGNGGGYSWLREHLTDGYYPQWYTHFNFDTENGPSADAALLTSAGDSRLYNYYVEGLQWLVKNIDIDGLYLDDVSFDRRTLKRMRRVMDSVKPGCLIDLHSNTGFSKGPAIQYTEFFPYIDKVWFGESFMYFQMTPENYLVESSGIPFGLTGDMLHMGGNKWLGMQYGMTVRYPWFTEGVSCDPRPVWKIWDEFGIEDSRMIGFWEDEPLVTTSDPEVKVTSYLKKDGSLLISVGNYSGKEKRVKLIFNTDRYDGCKLVAPEIEDFQDAAEWNMKDVISIASKQGLLLLVVKG